MEAKICDKCGKAYSKKLFEKTGAVFINHYCRPLFENSVSYDLCPECFKKLKEWINNEDSI